MTERTSYAPGTPSWIDLGSPDPAATAAFYGALFGWEVAMDPRPEAGGYGLFTLRGHNVAGVGPQMNGDMPPFWAVYVTVADADAALATAAEHGGTVIAGPMDVLEAGRMGVIQDPVGSFISVWQPDQHIGATLVNEPGTFTWNELATTDVAKARSFYPRCSAGACRRETTRTPTGRSRSTTRWCAASTRRARASSPPGRCGSRSTTATPSAAQATELGGTVLVPPNDMDFGRGAVIADPQGAVFGIGAMGG